MFVRDLALVLNTVQFDLLSAKWVIAILIVLYITKKTNFYGLKRLTSPITSKILSHRLKKLEKAGLIVKRIVCENPKRVEYYLSKQGETLAKAVVKAFNVPVRDKPSTKGFI